jgi:DNA polymerase-1
MDSKHGPLVIIDGHNLFIRNYVVNTMLDVNGARCGGTVGTVLSVKKLLRDLKPSNVLLVWDGEGGSQRRKQIYGAYKEGRTIRMNKREDDMEEDPDASLENMRQQRQNAADYLSMLGIPQVRADGVEADDLMAYVAGKMDHPNGCVIVTTDKDMLQLIKDNGCSHCSGHGYVTGTVCPVVEGGCGNTQSSTVRILSPIKKIMYDRATFISEHNGVFPENYRLVKALTGDKSDNIEGVRGFGEATIVRLFPFLTERVAAPADIMEAAVGISGSLGNRLREQESRFRENLSLMDLSDPMLSATAARQARDAMQRDLGCREMDLRIRLGRDGIDLMGAEKHAADTVEVFRGFVARRRKLLAECQSGGGENCE